MSSKDYYASLWDTAEELNRNDCFNDLAYRNMTFDRDDRPEHILSKAARAYAENFQPALEQQCFVGRVCCFFRRSSAELRQFCVIPREGQDILTAI